MKKLFPVFIAVVTFVCGLVLRFSFVLSDHSAWSYIISSVNASPWELFKPFGFVYIGMLPIELSVLRPRLLRFVCARICGLMLLCTLILSAGMLAGTGEWSELIIELSVLACMLVADMLSYRLYSAGVRVELFAAPLLCILCSFVLLLIILSFYPPHLPVFFDRINNIYGRMTDFDVLEGYRCFISDTFL